MPNPFDPVSYTPQVIAYLYEPTKTMWTVTVDVKGGLRQYTVQNSELPAGWATQPINTLKQMLKDAIIAQGTI